LFGGFGAAESDGIDNDAFGVGEQMARHHKEIKDLRGTLGKSKCHEVLADKLQKYDYSIAKRVINLLSDYARMTNSIDDIRDLAGRHPDRDRLFIRRTLLVQFLSEAERLPVELVTYTKSALTITYRKANRRQIYAANWVDTL
jgi:hypothetical protein